MRRAGPPPILQILRANMTNTTQTSLLNELTHKRDRGTSAIVEPDKCPHAFLGAKRGQRHVARLRDCVGKRFFTSDMLACFQGFNGNRRVQIIWNTNINQGNFGVLDQALPSWGRLRNAPFCSKFIGFLGMPARHRGQRWRALQIKKKWSLSPRIGMYSPHESRSNKTNSHFARSLGLRTFSRICFFHCATISLKFNH